MAEGKAISALTAIIAQEEDAQYVLALAGGGVGSNRKILGKDLSGAYITTAVSLVALDLATYGHNVTILSTAAGAINIDTVNNMQDSRLLTLLNSGGGNITFSGTVSALPDLAPGDGITYIQYAGTLWFQVGNDLDLSNVVFKDGTNAPFNGDIGVVTSDIDYISDLDANIAMFQVGETGFLWGESLGDSVSLSHNWYVDSSAENDKVVSDWAGRLHFDPTGNKMGFQYSPDTDPDTNFTPTWAWAITEDGDILVGPTTAPLVANADFTYTWTNDGYVIAVSKPGTGNNIRAVCRNCYIVEDDGLEVVCIATGNFTITIQFDFTGLTETYSKDSTASTITTLLILQAENRIYTFFGGDETDKFISFYAPASLGDAMNANTLLSQSSYVQNQLGTYSNLQSLLTDPIPASGILYDVWGAGFRTQEALQRNTSFLNYFSALGTDIENGATIIVLNNGNIVCIGSNQILGAPTVVVRLFFPLNGSPSQVTVSELIGQPVGLIANADQSALFLSDQDMVTEDYQILQSVDEGGNWTVAHADTDRIGGGVLMKNGILCFTKVLTGAISPRAIFSEDNGVTWQEGSVVPNTNDLNAGGLQAPPFNHITFMLMSDGTYRFNYRSNDAGVPIHCYSADTLTSAWTQIGVVYDASTNARNTASFVDPVSDIMYQGVTEFTNPPLTYALYRSTDMGLTWSQVWNNGAVETVVIKIDKDYRGILYMMTHEGIADRSVLYKSFDDGVTWEQASLEDPSDLNHLYPDMFFGNGIGRLLGVNRNDNDDFEVNVLDEVLEFATKDNTTPVKTRMNNKNLDVTISEQNADDGDKLNFSAPVVSLNKQFISILNNVNAAIVPQLAPYGCIFRNSEDKDSLWVKDMNGYTYPMDGNFADLIAPAGAWTPNLANTSLILGNALLNGEYYDTLIFPTGSVDTWYLQTQPPRGWTAGIVQVRVWFTFVDAPVLPDNVRFDVSMRQVEPNNTVFQLYSEVDVDTVIPTTSVPLLLSSPWYTLGPNVDLDSINNSLTFRIFRSGIGDNYVGDVGFIRLEVRWLAAHGAVANK